MLFDINANGSPIDRFGSVGGSVPGPVREVGRKISYVSWGCSRPACGVICLENPRVRGSIPRLATRYENGPPCAGRFYFYFLSICSGP
jgi:hypothetical protein